MSLLTYVITMYNCDKDIIDALSSFEKLINNKKINIIIVDDASTDNSVINVKEYIKNKSLKNVSLVQLDTNSGDASKPRNIAIDVCKTKYITFLDVDDTINYSTLKNVLKVLDKDYDLIKLEWNMIFPKSKLTLKYKRFKKDKKEILLHGPFMWNTIYKTKIIKSHNLKIRRGISEDLNFNIKYYSYCKKIKIVHKQLVNYNKVKSNVSNRRTFEEVLFLINNHIDSLEYMFNNPVYPEDFITKYIEKYIEINIENIFEKEEYKKNSEYKERLKELYKLISKINKN